MECYIRRLCILVEGISLFAALEFLHPKKNKGYCLLNAMYKRYMIKMYKHAFGRYRLQQELLRSQHKNTPKPQNRPSPKVEGSAKGSTNGDEAAVLKT